MENEISMNEILSEFQELRDKYGLPKTYAFIPDKINISLTRVDQGKFNIIYSESFSYLPDFLLKMAIQATVETLIQSGIPSDRIIPHDDGVQTEFDCDYLMLMQPLSELLLQHENILTDMDVLLDSLKNTIEFMHSNYDVKYHIDPQILADTMKRTQKFIEIFTNNPEISDEYNEIMKKFASLSTRYFESLDEEI